MSPPELPTHINLIEFRSSRQISLIYGTVFEPQVADLQRRQALRGDVEEKSPSFSGEDHGERVSMY
jgi:hypothetical protein